MCKYKLFHIEKYSDNCKLSYGLLFRYCECFSERINYVGNTKSPIYHDMGNIKNFTTHVNYLPSKIFIFKELFQKFR